jgi:glycerol-3-phosphate dehydrogenase
VTNDFSAQTRRANIEKLGAEMFDVVIVGGGITGAGIARDAAMRGYRVALVDKGDFASGTSSKSSKLVHGGVRYMELFEFGLVAEASRERRILWNIAPYLVHPLPFVFPIYRDARWPKWMIDVGMWMYDGLAMFRNFKRHRMLSTPQVEEMIRGIDTRNINGAAYYYDAQVDDARLTLETIRAAHRHGSIVANYVLVDELMKQRGRVVGVGAHDVMSGNKISVHARVVVNATGPWCDTLLMLDDPAAEPRMRPTKGIHILVARERIGGESGVTSSRGKVASQGNSIAPRDNVPAATFPAPDGRLMFLIPWNGFTIIGTTESDYTDDFDRVFADRHDVEYVLNATNHAFPKANLVKTDIISAYAGLRPLLTQVGKNVHQTSREHEIWSSESGLVTIAGGKLTTYREMARQLVDVVEKRLCEEFGIVAKSKGLTAVTPIGERDISVRGGAPLIEGLPYVREDVMCALEQEMAMTLTDVLERRTHILWEARDNGVSIAPQVAEIMAEFLDWNKTERDKQLRAYEENVRLASKFRSS